MCGSEGQLLAQLHSAAAALAPLHTTATDQAAQVGSDLKLAHSHNICELVVIHTHLPHLAACPAVPPCIPAVIGA